MAVATPHVLAAAPVSGLLLLLIAVVGFAVVVLVAAVIMGLIQAVLPGGDTEADALHAAELERQNAAPAEAPTDKEPASNR
jgi:hypothetical protein